MHTKMFYLQILVNGTLRNIIILFVYYAGCKKSVIEFLIDNDFSNKKLKKNYLKVIIFFQL